MGLDPATSCGYGIIDTDRPVSATIHSSFRCEGKEAFDKIASVRQKLPPLLRKYKPEFVAVERPLPFIPQFEKDKPDLLGGSKQTTINAGTIIQLSRLNGAVLGIVLGFNIPCCDVAPRTWQSIMPKSLKGKPKERVKQFCESMGISGGNVDSRDAAIIALWAAGHAQQLKLMKRAEEAA